MRPTGRVLRSKVLWAGARVGVPLALVLIIAGGAVALAAHRKVTRSDAHAVATAINLVHSDVPTLKAHLNTLTARDRQANAQLAGCIGENPPGAGIADVRSPDFDGPSPMSLTVDSETEILPSSAAVAKDLAAIRRPHALTCLRTAYTAALRESLPKTDTTTSSIARFSPPVASGTDASFGIRIIVDVHAKTATTTVTVPLYVDAIAFAYGQAEVTLDLLSAVTAPSPQLEAQLAKLLVARARRAIG